MTIEGAIEEYGTNFIAIPVMNVRCWDILEQFIGECMIDTEEYSLHSTLAFKYYDEFSDWSIAYKEVKQEHLNHHHLVPYMALQMKEVFGHEYYLEELLKRDVSFEEAFNDWVATGRAESFPSRFDEHYDVLENLCEHYCGDIKNCKGVINCLADKEELHKILYGRL